MFGPDGSDQDATSICLSPPSSPSQVSSDYANLGPSCLDQNAVSKEEDEGQPRDESTDMGGERHTTSTSTSL